MIEVTYKCKCTLNVGFIYLKPREDGEAIEAFMERIKRALRDHHSEWYPRCEETAVEWCKIPVQGKGGPNPIIGRVDK